MTGLLMLSLCLPAARSQAQLRTFDAPQGGKVTYGPVDDAATLPAAMSKVLRSLHNHCGEKPLIGRAFRERGSHSAAVFFTVVDHTQENKLMAGLLIAAADGPKQVEAALVTSDAAQFAQTVNPMLRQLSREWHPSGLNTPAQISWCGNAYDRTDPESRPRSFPIQGLTAQDRKAWDALTSPDDAQWGAPVALHTVEASDKTASVGIPDGWKLSAGSAAGALAVNGPQGELVVLNMARLAVDPTSPMRARMKKMGVDASDKDKIVYPASVDLATAFPDLIQQIRRLNGLVDPVDLQIDRADELPAPKGLRCVHVTGHLNPDGKGMQEMNTVMCASTPGPGGYYEILVFHARAPVAVADRESATIRAIFASFQLSTAIFDPPPPDFAPPSYRAAHRIHHKVRGLYDAIQLDIFGGQSVDRSRWYDGTSDDPEFSAYRFEPTAIQNDDKDGHGAAWNSAADELVKAAPDRFEILDGPESFKDLDF
jgi:hypothetical protein